jgi:ABC-type glycerol-3-phosphate transport system permease component
LQRIFKQFTVGRFFVYVIMITLACFMALPIVYLITTAFKPLDELFLFPPRFFVRHPTFQNFTDLVATLDSKTVPFARYLFNSLFTTSASVFGTVIISSMGGFAVAKLKLPGMKVFSQIVIYALMFSVPAAQIPIYLTISGMGLLNTYWALIVPKFAVPMYFFLYQQFVSQIPDALIESARLDGCGNFKVFRKIILPLTKAPIATIIVFSFVANWNDSFTPMIYINNQAMKTLPIILASIGSGGIARAGAGAAAAFLTTMPTILIYIFMQAKVMQTMAYSGVKG